MKNYDKLIKEIKKDVRFSVDKSDKRTTVKITFIETGELYSVHPGEKAYFPLKRWINKFKKEEK